VKGIQKEFMGGLLVVALGVAVASYSSLIGADPIPRAIMALLLRETIPARLPLVVGTNIALRYQGRSFPG